MLWQEKRIQKQIEQEILNSSAISGIHAIIECKYCRYRRRRRCCLLFKTK